MLDDDNYPSVDSQTDDRRSGYVQRVDEDDEPTDPGFEPIYDGRTATVLGDVYRERRRQDQRFGRQDLEDGTRADNAEYARRAREKFDWLTTKGQETFSDMLAEEFWEALAEVDPGRLRKELIQVAAVAVKWVEAIDRRRNG